MSGQKQVTREERLLERRTRVLGSAYRLFYDRPLHLVRGEGVWLYDADGRAYLDVYNNVPHVGHCHPHVVDALARQARTLNTHTRYLHETVLDYAERITATLPGELSVCMFACTGSEANELALRMAETCTGGRSVLVTEHAYHGNTGRLTELSTTHEYVQHRPYCEKFPAPDVYRGPLRGDDPANGPGYADYVGGALERIQSSGDRPAALLVDTIFSTDGILTAPSGFFPAAVEKIRAAGGLFIADEVQPGFGRTGDHMWGFEHYGVVPDIVTMGKPMGNGHPVSAVVTTPRLMEKFARTTRYFNTFGGNPVSCACGLAVLEVLERERLMENARQVGAYLKRKLQLLRDVHGIVGDLRGEGLFVGVELVRDRSTLEPAADVARMVVNSLRDRGVLISSTGPHNNVLKLRPPMVFSRDNVDQLVEALDRTLREV